MHAGVTEKVLQQKAQARTFFSKMLYLAESDLLEGSEALPAEDVHAVRCSALQLGILRPSFLRFVRTIFWMLDTTRGALSHHSCLSAPIAASNSIVL